jgi:hypothetical protein
MQYKVRTIGCGIVVINDVHIQPLESFIERLRDDNELYKNVQSKGYSGE